MDRHPGRRRYEEPQFAVDMHGRLVAVKEGPVGLVEARPGIERLRTAVTAAARRSGSAAPGTVGMPVPTLSRRPSAMSASRAR